MTDRNAASKSRAPAIGMFLGLLLRHSEYIMEHIRLHVSIATILWRKMRPPVNPVWVRCVIFLRVCASAEQLADTIIWLSVFFMHSGRVDNGSLKTATSLSPFTKNAMLEMLNFPLDLLRCAMSCPPARVSECQHLHWLSMLHKE